ncbi:MAG: hypothetical protein D6719_13495 [Candidatus Dadabacteria bacterium]|nr:MAG: hypothetical protein D6719_13495 [Candidatus Dadabacteria bacterium]
MPARDSSREELHQRFGEGAIFSGEALKLLQHEALSITIEPQDAAANHYVTFERSEGRWGQPEFACRVYVESSDLEVFLKRIATIAEQAYPLMENRGFAAPYLETLHALFTQAAEAASQGYFKDFLKEDTRGEKS